jgi:hypothetical protein
VPNVLRAARGGQEARLSRVRTELLQQHESKKVHGVQAKPDSALQEVQQDADRAASAIVRFMQANKQKEDRDMPTLVEEEIKSIVNNDGLSEAVEPIEETGKQPVHPSSFSRAAWLEAGDRLLLSVMASNWEIGDWALQTPHEATRDEVRELLEEAAARTGYQISSIRDLRTVAGRIPPLFRDPSLSWYGHKEISKLFVRENGETNEDKSIALRTEFIEKFAMEPQVGVLAIREAVRAKMGTATKPQETQTVSFKLTRDEFGRLKAVVDADPTHETVSNIIQELVLNFIREREAGL